MARLLMVKHLANIVHVHALTAGGHYRMLKLTLWLFAALVSSNPGRVV
jgi:hypothetical protein